MNTIHVTAEKTKYHSYALYFPFDRSVLQLCREIKESRGWKRFTFFEGKWRFDDLSIVVDLRKSGKVNVILPQELEAVVLGMQEREIHNQLIQIRSEEIKAAKETDFRPNGIRGELYPYQNLGVEFLNNSLGEAVLADAPGLGKTVQALGYIAHNNLQRSLIVCPASVKHAWKNEVARWTDLKSEVISSTTDVREILASKANVLIANYDILAKHLDVFRTMRLDCLVLDEFHMCKNLHAKRTKAARFIARSVPSIILLSGTPFLNRPEELWVGLNMIDPKEWDDYYEYTRVYCAGEKGKYGWQAKGATNLHHLHQRIGKYFLRRRKEEVLKDLPKKIFIDMPVELSDKDRRIYRQAEENFIQFMQFFKKKKPEEFSQHDYATQRLMQLSALRSLTTEFKVEAAAEHIESIIESGEKVVVFSCYVEPLKTLQERFSEVSVILTGSSSEEQRSGAVERFQKDPGCKVFFGGIKSAGVGITLTAGTNVLFVDFSWTPADHLQAQDRIHRIGQTAESVNIVQLYALDTLDAFLLNLLAEKKKVFDAVIEGRVDSVEGDVDFETLAKELYNSRTKQYGSR